MGQPLRDTSEEELWRRIHESGTYVPNDIVLIISGLFSELRDVTAKLNEVQERTRCSMGVGDGSGKMFVYGDHDSIKAAQRIVLERDAMRRSLQMELPNEIREAAEYVRDRDGWTVHDPYGSREEEGNRWFEEQAKVLATYVLPATPKELSNAD